MMILAFNVDVEFMDSSTFRIFIVNFDVHLIIISNNDEWVNTKRDIQFDQFVVPWSEIYE